MLISDMPCESMTTPAKEVVLITGCSAGSIGNALAREFHGRRWHVIATARSLQRILDLQDLGIHIEELELTSSASIDALRQRVTSLDNLFNNAGEVYI
jgi:1-acylglycerone phosphate reductase